MKCSVFLHACFIPVCMLSGVQILVIQFTYDFATPLCLGLCAFALETVSIRTREVVDLIISRLLCVSIVFALYLSVAAYVWVFFTRPSGHLN